MGFFKKKVNEDVLTKKQVELKENVNRSIDALNQLESIVQDLNDTNIKIENQSKEIVEIKAQFDVIQGELANRQSENQKIIDKFRK